MKKTVKRKLTLSKETIAHLEAGKLTQVVGGGGVYALEGKFSDNWEQTTCM